VLKRTLGAGKRRDDPQTLPRSSLESVGGPRQTVDMGQEDRDWYRAESKPVWSLGGGFRGAGRSGGGSSGRSVVGALLAAGIMGGLWWLESRGYGIREAVERGFAFLGL
jgi:hypothetical protein